MVRTWAFFAVFHLYPTMRQNPRSLRRALTPAVSMSQNKIFGLFIHSLLVLGILNTLLRVSFYLRGCDLERHVTVVTLAGLLLARLSHKSILLLNPWNTG